MYSDIVELIRPFPLSFLAASLIWFFAWLRNREWRRTLFFLYLPWFAIGVSCTPAFAYLAAGTLEWSYPFIHSRPPDVPAIVILAGGGGNSMQPGEILLAEDSLRRCWGGADLYRGGPRCLVFTSGGTIPRSPDRRSLAGTMGVFLAQLGVDPADIVCEETSTDTYENAVETARLLRQRGIDRVVLVTDATHLWRAERCFQAVGIEVVPAGAFYRAGNFEWRLAWFLPQAHDAVDVQVVWHEYLGMAWYKLRGRL